MADERRSSRHGAGAVPLASLLASPLAPCGSSPRRPGEDHPGAAQISGSASGSVAARAGGGTASLPLAQNLLRRRGGAGPRGASA